MSQHRTHALTTTALTDPNERKVWLDSDAMIEALEMFFELHSMQVEQIGVEWGPIGVEWGPAHGRDIKINIRVRRK